MELMGGVLGASLPVAPLHHHSCVCEMFLRCRFCLVGIILLSKIDLSLSRKSTFLQNDLYEERS